MPNDFLEYFMRDVIQLTSEFRTRCEELQDGLADHLNRPAHEPPLIAFGMCFNNATISLELLSYYEEIWGRLIAIRGFDAERTRKDNGHRVVEITKWAFVQCLSAIEYSAKQAIASGNVRAEVGKGRVYLRNIIETAADEGWIEEADAHQWYTVIEIRNTVVHNNGVAERNGFIQLPDREVSLKSGQMVEGNLKTFPHLSRWSVEAFARWCKTAAA